MPTPAPDDKTPVEVPENAEKITFGAGCFWCTEAFFERIDGVLDVRSGYLGGHVPNPTYKQICTGLTGHNEVSELTYDPEKITVEELYDIFWDVHDPTTLNRQGADVGTPIPQRYLLPYRGTKGGGRKIQGRPQKTRSPTRSSRRFFQQRRSMWPRITTKITTRTIPASPIAG